MFAAAAIFAGLVAATNYLVNPYGAFALQLFSPIFRNLKEERLATPYLIRTARPETMLIGSSRVLLGIPIPQGERDGVMNAALAAGTMEQLSAVVRLAVENPRLRQIIWGVDFFTFDENWRKVDPQFDLRIQNDVRQKLEDAIISASAFADSRNYLMRMIKGRSRLPRIATTDTPWPRALICNDFEARRNAGLTSTAPASIQHQLIDDVPNYPNYQFSQQYFDLFRDTVNLARAHGIRVTLFVPPLNQYELEMIRLGGRWDAFQNWKRMLVTVGPYVDFSGYNEISQSDWMFMHLMHFKSAVGEAMLRVLLDQPLANCSTMTAIVVRSAMRVEADSIDHALNEQEGMRLAIAADDSRYARMVAAVLKLRRPGAASGRVAVK
jgi:hypothetical protein